MFSGCAESRAKNALNYRTGAYYCDLLNATSATLHLWETTYYHIVENHDELINWYKGTGTRPFVDRLPEGFKDEFMDSVRLKCKAGYSAQSDGKVIFPFIRLFVIAHA